MTRCAKDSKPHVIVLGGGLAGLAVAREALRTGAGHATVLEKAERTGGMAISPRIGSAGASDLGPHRIYSAIPQMREWFAEFLGERLFEVRRSSRMFINGRFVRYPPAPLELAGALGAGAMGRFAIGWLWARARAVAGRLPADSFGAVMERAYGRPLCEALVFPYIRKAWQSEPEAISAESARARATMGGVGRMAARMLGLGERAGRESTVRTFHYVRGGIEELPRALAGDVERLGGEIVCRAEVRNLIVEDSRVAGVEFWRNGADGAMERLEGDFVFSTIPAPEAAEALERGGYGDSVALEAARGLRFLNAILVFAVLDRPSLSAEHWLYFPQAQPAINRAYESRNFEASMATANRTIVCIEATTLPDGEAWRGDDGDLARHLIEQLASTGILRPDEVVEARVHRLECAYPLYEIGFEKRLAIVLRSFSHIENFISLGRQGLFQHNNMDHTIYTALRAAHCWAQESEPARVWFEKEIPAFRDFRIVD